MRKSTALATLALVLSIIGLSIALMTYFKRKSCILCENFDDLNDLDDLDIDYYSSETDEEDSEDDDETIATVKYDSEDEEK